MSAYALLKFVHVVLAITAVGANITYGFWLSRAARHPQHLPYVLRGVKFLDDRVANPAFGLLLLTGVAMVIVGRLPWTTPWLLSSIVLYAIMMLIAALAYTPTLRRQIQALEAGGPDSPAFKALAARATRTGILVAVIVLIIIFMMVTKPNLWG